MLHTSNASASGTARPLRDSAASNRFTPDTAMLRRVFNYLSSKKAQDLTLLPGTPEALAKLTNPYQTVAAILLASGKFNVEGFFVSPQGVDWAEHPEVPVLARPYAYLSHLLRMDGADVILLFGAAGLNDIMLHQFEPYPKTDQGLLVSRLTHFLREGYAICPL